jgi:hypothetical protein
MFGKWLSVLGGRTTAGAGPSDAVLVEHGQLVFMTASAGEETTKPLLDCVLRVSAGHGRVSAVLSAGQPIPVSSMASLPLSSSW